MTLYLILCDERNKKQCNFGLIFINCCRARVGCETWKLSLEGQEATINLFTCINWLLRTTLTPGFSKAIMGFSRPLSILLGHYGCCATPVIAYRPARP